jgi:uncharacterized membrane protein (DUF485 family)
MNEHALTDSMMQREWEPRVSNFCAYWRATIFRLIAAFLLFSVLALMLLALGFTFYRDPVAALSVISGLVIAFGSIVGALWLSTKSKSVTAFLRGDGKDDKPEGLVSMKYRALKSKICPVVQFEDKG